MKIFISFLISFTLFFTNFVYASEVETTLSSDSPFKSLQDFIDNGTQGLNELRGVASSFGDFADASIQTLINAPVKAVASNFLACSQDMLDTSVDVLVSSRDFMSNIFVDTINKTFSWNTETVKIGHDVLVDRFQDTSYEGVAEGFYKCDYTNWYTGPGYGYYYFCSNIPNCYFTRVGNLAIICSFDATYYATIQQYNYGSIPTSDFQGSDSDTWYFSSHLDKTDFLYADKAVALVTSEYRNKFPQIYSDSLSAVRAFYNHVPQEVTRPNGKGWFRPLPKNTTVKANGNNVYNVNWGDIIVNNYNTYGDTFENTVINNYYYSATNPSTPNYWYDDYIDTPVSVPSHDYDDLTDITLSNPDIQVNHNFITDVFGSFPVVLTTLFLSLLVLAAVLIFLRG